MTGADFQHLSAEGNQHRGIEQRAFEPIAAIQRAPADQIVYDEDPTNAAKLLAADPQYSPYGLKRGTLSAPHSGSPVQAAAMSFVIVLTGFLGGLAMSAVKRSLGAKDWGQMIEGHGGMLDRLDSVSFAAPVFFHLTRYFFEP